MQKYDLMIADPICSMLIALLIGVRWVRYYKPWPLSTRLETILHPQTPPRNPQQHLTQIIQKPLHSALHQEPCEAVGAPAGWITGYTLRGWRPEHFLNMWQSQKTQHVTLSCGHFSNNSSREGKMHSISSLFKPIHTLENTIRCFYGDEYALFCVWCR